MSPREHYREAYRLLLLAPGDDLLAVQGGTYYLSLMNATFYTPPLEIVAREKPSSLEAWLDELWARGCLTNCQGELAGGVSPMVIP